VVEVITPDGSTQYDYDVAVHKVSRIEDALHHVTRMVYNSEGDPIKIIDANNKLTQQSWVMAS